MIATALLRSTVPAILAAYPSGFTTSTIGYTEMRKLMSAAQKPAREAHFSHLGNVPRSVPTPTSGIANIAM
jgi:hypothetical protein